jgi:hypothetical protein
MKKAAASLGPRDAVGQGEFSKAALALFKPRLSSAINDLSLGLCHHFFDLFDPPTLTEVVFV